MWWVDDLLVILINLGTRFPEFLLDSGLELTKRGETCQRCERQKRNGPHLIPQGLQSENRKHTCWGRLLVFRHSSVPGPEQVLCFQSAGSADCGTPHHWGLGCTPADVGAVQKPYLPIDPSTHHPF